MRRSRAMTEQPPLTYEAATARLEAIIKRLDSGEAGLRETLDLVREGRGLVEFCAGELDVSSAFTRVSTLIRLRGGGEEGIGEDVTYDAVDHDVLQSAGPVLPLAGERTLGEFCDHLEALDLWP